MPSVINIIETGVDDANDIVVEESAVDTLPVASILRRIIGSCWELSQDASN